MDNSDHITHLLPFLYFFGLVIIKNKPYIFLITVFSVSNGIENLPLYSMQAGALGIQLITSCYQLKIDWSNRARLGQLLFLPLCVCVFCFFYRGILRKLRTPTGTLKLGNSRTRDLANPLI